MCIDTRRNVFAHATVGFALLALSGCVTHTQAIDGYWDGPTADVTDTMFNESKRRADFCVLEALDGRLIYNSIYETSMRTQGKGLTLYPYVTTRSIKVHPMTVTLRCSTVHAAEVLAIGHRTLSVAGTVHFEPRENARYVVKGAQLENGFSVWIQDEADGRIVTEKVFGAESK